jgi:hypothetical protein
MNEKCPFCGFELDSQPFSVRVPTSGIYKTGNMGDIEESPICPNCGAEYLKGQDKIVQARERRREIGKGISSDLDDLKERIGKIEKKIEILIK